MEYLVLMFNDQSEPEIVACDDARVKRAELKINIESETWSIPNPFYCTKDCRRFKIGSGHAYSRGQFAGIIGVYRNNPNDLNNMLAVFKIITKDLARHDAEATA